MWSWLWKGWEPLVSGLPVLTAKNPEFMPQHKITLWTCLCVIALTTSCVSLLISNIICFQQVVRSPVCFVMSNGRLAYSGELFTRLHDSNARFGCYHNKFFWWRKGKHFTKHIKLGEIWGSDSDTYEGCCQSSGMCCHDRGNKLVWNISQCLPDYMDIHPSRQTFLYKFFLFLLPRVTNT